MPDRRLFVFNKSCHVRYIMNVREGEYMNVRGCTYECMRGWTYTCKSRYIYIQASQGGLSCPLHVCKSGYIYTIKPRGVTSSFR